MASNASLDNVISHWCTLIENFQASPLQFSQSVEAALERRQAPQTKNDRVDYKESGVLSAKREYLHVTREHSDELGWIEPYRIYASGGSECRALAISNRISITLVIEGGHLGTTVGIDS